MKQLNQQAIPIVLTVITFVSLVVVLFSFIHILNFFPVADKIIPRLHIADILVGLTIYIKTSVDFAMFIGNLMSKNPGIKSRIAIEIGTALGNAAGTLFVLFIWTFFKEVPALMIVMILLAALVLLTLAEEGLQEFNEKYNLKFFILLLKVLQTINIFFSPLLQFIIPKTKTRNAAHKTFLSLLFFSLTIPLILGLDDFAGYIPLFNIINVFGFATGVFLGHMLLNIALFASPTTTIALVRKPLIALFGSLAFIGIALWGFVEIFAILPKII